MFHEWKSTRWMRQPKHPTNEEHGRHGFGGSASTHLSRDPSTEEDLERERAAYQ